MFDYSELLRSRKTKFQKSYIPCVHSLNSLIVVQKNDASQIHSIDSWLHRSMIRPSCTAHVILRAIVLLWTYANHCQRMWQLNILCNTSKQDDFIIFRLWNLCENIVACVESWIRTANRWNENQILRTNYWNTNLLIKVLNIDV